MAGVPLIWTEINSPIILRHIKYEGKEYLVNQSGKIQKNKKNVKDADEVYYSTDKDGIVTSAGNKK